MNISKFLSECFMDSDNNIRILNEAIRSRDIDKAQALISSYLLKRKIYTMPLIKASDVDKGMTYYVEVFNDRNEGAYFLWKAGNTQDLWAVGFTKDFANLHASLNTPGGRSVLDVLVESKGASIVQLIKMVEEVLTGNVRMDLKSIRALIEDATIFESLNFKKMFENIVFESNNLQALEKAKTRAYNRLNNARKGKKVYTAEEMAQFEADLETAKKNLAVAKLNVRSGVSVVTISDPEIDDAQDDFEDELRATPEERFEDMANYVIMVMTGIRNLALLCGAPGVGKTHRVMQMVHKEGKVKGDDYELLKGKATPSELFKLLFEYRQRGKLIIMDDCDSILTNPEGINLLKAAYDSSEDRWVSWNISTPIFCDNQELIDNDPEIEVDSKGRYKYPKQFLYNGGGIIITNFTAGMIDTAVKNRALICDLAFTTQEIFELIEGLSDKIGVGKLSEEAKSEALDFLREKSDKGANMELSLRSFIACAEIFQCNAPASSKKRMVNEQMRLQFLRGGKKY